MTFLSATSSSPPAGGAALDQIVIATLGALVVTSIVLAVGLGHRSGRVGLLARAAGQAERLTGIPGWASLPSGIAAASLLTAVFGMYWDISLHIDVGRDPGPLANPAHYFILAGLFGILTAGFVAIALPRGRPSASAITVAPGWQSPLGGVLIFACGAFSLIGFPLDDVWHRLFGQDVTLWGPTHLMLIGGAAMTLVGIAVLMVEAHRAGERRAEEPRQVRWMRRARLVALSGGLLAGLSTFQGEFDFGIPQFQLLFQPMLIMLAAGVGLVATRVWLGRGAALGAVAFFLAVRGGLALAVGPLLGESTPHFPLYVVEAGIVEAVALVIPRERPLALGAWSGALIGTVGLAAEWGWSHVWMPLPWPAALLGQVAPLGFAMALAGSLIGAWLGVHLVARRPPRTRSLRVAAVVSSAAVAAMVAYGLHAPADRGVSATVALHDVSGGAQRAVGATVALHPAGAADRAGWLTATAWQGGGLVVDRLAPVKDGLYRTTRPIPVHGSWKAMLRLHSGHSLTAVPIYLPADAAIPVGQVSAPAHFTRAFVSDHRLLQRERKTSSPAVTTIAYGVVAAIALSLLALLAWGLHRLALAALDEASAAPARRDRRLRPARAATRTARARRATTPSPSRQ